jgi:hypothetical protein
MPTIIGYSRIVVKVFTCLHIKRQKPTYSLDSRGITAQKRATFERNFRLVVAGGAN